MPHPVTHSRSTSGWLGGIAVFHALAVIVLLSWRFGGLEEQTHVIATWLCAPAPILTAIALYRAEPQFRRRLAWVLIPLTLIVISVLVSVANPHMRPYVMEPGSISLGARDDYVRWLPSTAWPQHTLRDFTFNACLVLVGLNVLLTQPGRRFQLTALNVITINAGVLACTGSVFKLLGATEILGRYPSPNTNFFATFVYYNHWGAFAILGIAASAALALYHLRRNPARAWHDTPAPLFATIALLIIASLPLSGGRGSMAAGVLLVLLLAGRFAPRQRQGRMRIRHAFAAVSIALALVVGATLWLARDRIEFWSSKTSGQLAEMHGGGIGDARTEVYRQTWNLFLERPVFGWGWQSFRYVFRNVQSFDFKMQTEQREASLFLDAHNDWLQRLAELGLVGAVLSAAVFIGLARMARPEMWRITPSCELIAGLIALGALACIDFPFACPAVVVTAWTLLAVAADIACDRDLRSRGV